jgi:hexokinase
MKEFELSVDQLKEIADSLRERIKEGLAEDDQEIKCLATYLHVPDGSQCGKALVVDTGGTNMRAALVTLDPRNGQINAGPVSAKVRGGRQGEPVKGSDFFKEQAQLTQDLDLPQETLPLGYCFSYPARCQPDGEAVLIRWTKGINITGVAGNPVGRPLMEALADLGVPTKGLSVLNDTVASLLGGAHLFADPEFGHNYIGLILGTGTNMAGVFTPEQLKKVECDYNMVVNLESGNFNPPHLNKYDDGVDNESIYKGAQRFEKAISGHYLPYVFQQVRPGVFDPAEGTGVLVRMRDNQEEHGEVAAAILKRSARMAAAGLAAVASFYPTDQPIAILGEGTLLWGDPQYAPTMDAALDELLPGRDIRLVRQRNNVNLLGAASAALSLLKKSTAS